MNYAQRHERSCGGTIWSVKYTTFWQTVTVWTSRLNAWANQRATETATYTLIKGGVDYRSE